MLLVFYYDIKQQGYQQLKILAFSFALWWYIEYSLLPCGAAGESMCSTAANIKGLSAEIKKVKTFSSIPLEHSFAFCPGERPFMALTFSQPFCPGGRPKVRLSRFKVCHFRNTKLMFWTKTIEPDRKMDLLGTANCHCYAFVMFVKFVTHLSCLSKSTGAQDTASRLSCSSQNTSSCISHPCNMHWVRRYMSSITLQGKKGRSSSQAFIFGGMIMARLANFERHAHCTTAFVRKETSHHSQ